MIKGISVTNHLGQTLKMSLTEPEESGFIIKSISGLGPVKADVNFTELATNDGAIDNSARLQSRDIVLTLIFLAKDTIEETRLTSYKYFPIKRNVTFAVETDNRKCQIVGRVEENKPDIFSKEEGCQITIMCPDSYFQQSGPDNREIFYGTYPLFEFPFSNESLTEPLIEFGSIQLKTEATVFYEGDGDVGVTIKIHAIGSAKGLSIYNLRTREVMGINDEKLKNLVEDGISAGDDIIIDTNRGQKGIILIRSGVIYNILNALEKPISWFRLEKGDNLFTYIAEAGIENLTFEVRHKILYEGV